MEMGASADGVFATLTLSDNASISAAEVVPAPYLVLGIECAHPMAGAARYSLAGIGEVKIGRGKERRARRTGRVLAIEVPDSALSIEHLRLIRDRARWTICDMSSKNGTHINGVRAVRQALEDRDVIEAGQTFFVLRAVTGNINLGDLSLAVDAGDLTTLDPGLAASFAMLKRIAHADVPLLITGETGTGKEIAARAAHELSGRQGHCVAVNCAAIAPGLIESELFGHRRGAFAALAAPSD